MTIKERVLEFIQNNLYADGCFYLSNQQIAEELELTPTQVNNSINYLVQLGIIDIVDNPGDIPIELGNRKIVLL